MTPDEMHEAFERAYENITAKLKAVDDRYFPGGLAYDQQEFKSDAEFIAFVLDLQNYPSPEFPTWEFLPDVSQTLFEDLRHRYEKAIAKQIGAR